LLRLYKYTLLLLILVTHTIYHHYFMMTIDGVAVVRPFTDSEIDSIRTGINSWDDALDSISFKETANYQNSDIQIGLINLSRHLAGYWYSNWDSNLVRYKGYIKVNPNSIFLNKEGLVHTIQHEFGNILGLGDIKPNEKIVSVMEDPFQDFYGNPVLGDFDITIIRQLYGESTCTISFAKNQKQGATPIVTNNDIEKEQIDIKTEIIKIIKKEKVEIVCKNNKKTLTIYRYNKDYPCPKGYSRV
jgi:hypothetical protein